MPMAVRGNFTSVELNNAIVNLSIFLRDLNYMPLFSGYELFGNEKLSCEEGEWEEEVPHCATNVAK